MENSRGDVGTIEVFKWDDEKSSWGPVTMNPSVTIDGILSFKSINARKSLNKPTKFFLDLEPSSASGSNSEVSSRATSDASDFESASRFQICVSKDHPSHENILKEVREAKTDKNVRFVLSRQGIER